MNQEALILFNLAEALGIGLLIGAERERRMSSDVKSLAGIRTFAITALLGAIAQQAGGVILLATAIISILLLAGLAYWRDKSENIGLTTEVALVMTVLLGGLSVTHPVVAAGAGVVVAVLLASRAFLHGFVRSVMTEQELRDGLMLAAATLVVLPILPNRTFGPYGVLNPYLMWSVVIMVMVIAAAGHVAVRLYGAQHGLALTGFASGFVSSTATIRDMARRTRSAPAQMRGAAAGACLSSLSTVVTMSVVLAAASVATLNAMALPLLAGGLAAVLYAAPWTIAALRAPPVCAENPPPDQGATPVVQPRVISLTGALAFSAALAGIMLASTAVQQEFGLNAMIAAAALAGIVNTQSAAISVALMVGAGQIAPQEAVLPILAAISTNTGARVVLAVTLGRGGFAGRVVPGLILGLAAAWAAFLLPVPAALPG
ncbi:MgtC/SapB family protein [Rubritepida flocculans]|uniref:MgtC/SapB family protein n=1 Tax=Rubritepida flocculans TaxID=182403 RepID=UPI00041E4243|nr:DUF4010 domain-containing protein [Rubritepida flocculans]